MVYKMMIITSMLQFAGQESNFASLYRPAKVGWSKKSRFFFLDGPK